MPFNLPEVPAEYLQQGPAQSIFIALVIILILRSVYHVISAYSRNDFNKYPLINGISWWDPFGTSKKKRFVADSKALLVEGFSKAKNGFRLQTENGVELVLPPSYANDIKDHPSLSLPEHMAEQFHAHLPGFDTFRQGTLKTKIFETAVKDNLTRAVDKLVKPVSEETSLALEKIFTNQPEWHDLEVKNSVLQAVCQISGRAFLGEKLGRDPKWMSVLNEYTIDSFVAATALRMWPSFLRRLGNHILPTCYKLRVHLKNVRRLIEPTLQERRREKEERSRKGLKPIVYIDAMAWLEEAAKGREYDPAAAQVFMAIAANYTGSDAVTQLILDIARQPDLLEDLRKEIISVMAETNNMWEKASIYKLSLMDSVLKESQRLKPTAIAVMRRLATDDLVLSDGTFLAKGSKLMVTVDNSWDEKYFTNPHIFDGYRFLLMRQQGITENVQFVSTAPSTLGFGHGKYACPGRFFASMEIKVFLCHLLMKYDIKLTPDTVPEAKVYGFFYHADENAKILIRRRQEEFSL